MIPSKAIKMLEKHLSDIDKEIEQQIKDKKEIWQKINIIQKYMSKSPITQDGIQEVFNLLCFKNIGYCCGLDKPCVWRDTVRYIFGITDEKFCAVKNKIGFELAHSPQSDNL